MTDYPHLQALVLKSGENFPVGSQLFPAQARRPLWHFYAFARYADNIADSREYATTDKRRWLLGLKQALLDGDFQMLPETVHPFYRDVAAGTTNAEHGLRLLAAFLQDVWQTSYPTYQDLLAYCHNSAVPVGRVVLELCGEDKADLEAADNLCIALQLLNHLQDCKKDFLHLRRIYLPQEWFQAFGVSRHELENECTSLPLRRLFEEYLLQCRLLLHKADHLPASIKSKRLRMELAFTLELAWELARRLEKQDPLAGRVQVNKRRWPLVFLSSLRRLK